MSMWGTKLGGRFFLHQSSAKRFGEDSFPPFPNCLFGTICMSTRWANIILTQKCKAKERGDLFSIVRELTKDSEAKCFLSLHFGWHTVKFDHFYGKLPWSISMVLMRVVELKRFVAQ